MAEQGQSQSTEGQQSQSQPNEQGQSSGGSQAAGTGTDSQQGQQQQGQQSPADDKKFTQAQVDEMFKTRLKKAVQAELKKLSGEQEGQASVEDLQRGVEEAQRNLRFYQARDQVEDYIADKRNGQIKNVRAFCRYFKDDFTFDDQGQVTNLKDLYTRAKVETPELLGMVTGSADGAAGNGQAAVGGDMNQIIRGAVGYTPR